MPKRKPRRRIQRVTGKPKKCFFCENKKTPSFADSTDLSKFLTERGKIMPGLRSGLCAKHQRQATREIKHARHLGLLPFIVR